MKGEQNDGTDETTSSDLDESIAPVCEPSRSCWLFSGAVLIFSLILGLTVVGVFAARRSNSAQGATQQGFTPSGAPNLRSEPPSGENSAVQTTTYFFESTPSPELATFLDDSHAGEFYIVSLMKFKDRAVYEDGRPTNLSGFEANIVYSAWMVTVLLPSIDSDIVYQANVERDLANPDTATQWDSVAIVRYANKTVFREMIENPEFQEQIVHHRAALEEHTLMATTVKQKFDFPLPTNPPFPPSDADLPFAFMHVFDYRDFAQYQEGDEDADNNRTGEEAVGLYSSNAGSVAGPLGVSPLIFLNVDAVLSGPEQGWDEVRVNLFPSHKTFEALTADSTWQSGYYHRIAGMNKTYALMTSPININQLTPTPAPVPIPPPTTQPTAYFYESDASELFSFLDLHPPGEEFYMVNVIKYNDKANYEDGRPTNLTGVEANAIYGEWMQSVMLPSIDSEIVYSADVERDLNPDAVIKWDFVAVVRYANGTVFREMISNPGFQERLVHKHAGVYETIVLATTVISKPNLPLPTNSPFPPTETDLPFAFMHIMDFNDVAQYQEGDEDADNNRTGKEAVSLYGANAGTVAFPLGIRPLISLNVEAVISGPQQGWNEVQVNRFPSHRSFEALTSDPTWQSGLHHRQAGLNKTHALMTSPITTNKLSPSVAADPTPPPTAQPTAYFYESNPAELFAFLDTHPLGEAFYMVNVIKYRDRAIYRDGRPTNLTGSAANAIYTSWIQSVMFPAIDSEVVYSAAVEIDGANPNATIKWDTAGVVRYANTTVFRQMIANPEFQEMLAHKTAGVYETVVLATSVKLRGFPLLEDPPFPPTDTDLSFAFMHILDYNDFAQYQQGDDDADGNRTGEQAVGVYNANAAPVVFPLGVRPLVFLNVEAVVAGPELGWEEVRINFFPSHRTLDAVTSNPTWQSGYHHRIAGVTKTYALMTSPIRVNQFI